MGYYIDTSMWQGSINVEALDCEGVIPKMSQGASIVDRFFVDTFSRCRARNMPVAPYHFMTHAAYQGTHIENTLNRVGLSIHTPLPPGVGFAVDFEPNSITGEPAPPVGLLADLCGALGAVWGRERVSIYSDLSRHGAYANSPRAAELAPHPKWIAWPGPQSPYLPADTVLWQWGIESGVPGVDGRVDVNEVLDRERQDRWFGLTAAPPGPPPITPKEVTMFQLVGPGGSDDGVFLVDVTTIRWVQSGHEVAVLNQAGVVTVTAAVEQIHAMRYARTPFGPSPTSGSYVGLW